MESSPVPIRPISRSVARPKKKTSSWCGHGQRQPSVRRPSSGSEPFSSRGVIDFGRYTDRSDYVSAYALFPIYCLEDRDVAILAGTDDQARIWLNGALLYESLRARPALPDEDAIRGTLKSGWNALLVRVANENAASIRSTCACPMCPPTSPGCGTERRGTPGKNSLAEPLRTTLSQLASLLGTLVSRMPDFERSAEACVASCRFRSGKGAKSTGC